MMKKLLFAILTSLLPLTVAAADLQTVTVAFNWNASSTTMTFPLLTGGSGALAGLTGSIAGNDRIKTTGSSITVDEVTASSGPFGPVLVGDVLEVKRPAPSTVTDLRVVETRASAAQVTVNPAVDWSGGFVWRWWKLVTGTGDTAGWINVSAWTDLTIIWQLEQITVDAGGIDMRVECKSNAMGALPVQIFPTCAPGACGTLQNYTAAGIASRTPIKVNTNEYGWCPVGVVVADDDAVDTGAAAERVVISLQGRAAS